MPSTTRSRGPREPCHPEVLGRTVQKYFLNDNGAPELFDGMVQKFRWDEDYRKYLYHVDYEDDDAESLYWEDVKEMLVPDGEEEEGSPSSPAAAAAATAAVTTPIKSTEVPVVSPQASQGDSDHSGSMNLGGDDDSSLDLPMDEDDEESVQVKTPKQMKNTTNKSQKNLAAKKPSVLTSTKSIAKWGLPRGALARCPRTNFTVRALDSIPPNPTDPSALLPGRLLLVATDQAGLVDKRLVGESFESSTALHKQIQQGTDSKSKIRFATYELLAVSDPAFSSWEFAMARLHSISRKMDDDTSGERATMVCISWDGESVPLVDVSYWQEGSCQPVYHDDDEVRWALLESRDPEILPVLLGAPTFLLQSSSEPPSIMSDTRQNCMDLEALSFCEDENSDLSFNSLRRSDTSASNDLLPQHVNAVAGKVKLAASLLQKSIRRGSMLSSAVPLLEASRDLIHPVCAVPGSTFAFLKTLWGCMLVDVMPFADSSDCLGLPSVLALSLIAKADPQWVLPRNLRRAAVASALRTSRCRETKQWVGFVSRDDGWHCLETIPADLAENKGERKSILVRNILRATQSVAGDTVAWGRWNTFTGEPSAAAALAYTNLQFDGSILRKVPEPVRDEVPLLEEWEKGVVPEVRFGHKMLHLDQECRLAAIEPAVFPHLLVLLQAVLAQLPRSWKKHSLPSLSRQVRKLSTEANPRIQETLQLARLATWGKDKSRQSLVKSGSSAVGKIPHYNSYREVITTTGSLSEGETELVDCLEAIQKWQFNRTHENSTAAATANISTGQPSLPVALTHCPVKAGPPLSSSDGRIAFLLAFAEAIEVEVCGEVVSAMFCGDEDEPLLVQRIGKARKEGNEMATAGGATSGATAVPSLGYVQRARSQEEANLMEAAENAVAEYWNGGIDGVLPLPPVGFQWEVGINTSTAQIWDALDQKVLRTVELNRDVQGKAYWNFSVAGIRVKPFDARPIISPCRLDIDDNEHQPMSLEPVQEKHLRILLYVHDDPNAIQKHGGAILEAMMALHDSAEAHRANTPNEGLVYDWLQVAQASPIPSRTWRDALLAIRTRLHDHVILGQGIRSNGTGTPHDMSEGVLVRILHSLECLYPMALRKESAFKFRVRPLGASYHHLLRMLERLGRGLVAQPPVTVLLSADTTPKRKFQEISSSKKLDMLAPRSKRPRRKAASVASKKLATSDMLTAEDDSASNNNSLDIANFDDNQIPTKVKVEKSVTYLPTVTTKLWDHQRASSDKVIAGVTLQGKRGLADASAVGAGKTLTALSVIVRLAEWLDQSGKTRHGSLVMLPTKALIREWLREIASHTTGFHVVEQREDGTLFSLTYNKKNCPIDSNTIVITTLDRVCSHPFVRQSAWDFVVIDECLSVQNANAKRTPSAWRQIEISTCGVLMLSATFFRSKYNDLFYMIRMLRSPFPKTKEWLPATIHEHIVCQIPETDRSWQMIPEIVQLKEGDLKQYRSRVDAFKRRQLNDPERANGLELFKDLRLFLRQKYEGRQTTNSTAYDSNSIMAEAISKLALKLLRKCRRPLIFADTGHEADFLVRVLKSKGIRVETWTSIATKQISGGTESSKNTVIVAVKTIEGQGINMQHHADALICRPTAGDHLEQMKGRIDRPGQKTKELQLYVVFCGHTIEEAAFANIHLAGNFFRQYIAPVAERYREMVDLKAALTVAGKQKLKPGTVLKAWRKELESAGQSGSFASVNAGPFHQSPAEEEDNFSTNQASLKHEAYVDELGPKYKPRNTVLVNKGDQAAVKEAKERARNGEASPIIHAWLFAKSGTSGKRCQVMKGKSLPHTSVLRYSDQKPPLILDAETVKKAVAHLTANDPKLAALIARVGADALIGDIGTPQKVTQGRLFDRALRAITFTMVSLDAGNVFMKKLAIKIGVLIETYPEVRRNKILSQLIADMQESGSGRAISPEAVLKLLLEGRHNEFVFTPELVGELVSTCYKDKGKRVGHPHLSGDTVPCGKNDDPQVFLDKARSHVRGGPNAVSAGYSIPKASFIISLVDDFKKNKISGQKVADASDREAFQMLTQLKGIGDWSAGQILMHQFNRADIMLYGDLTVRNYLNDLYDINHADDSETLLESAADFDDNATNRNLIDDIAERNGWKPYRSVVNYLMYHLQEENLVLL